MTLERDKQTTAVEQDADALYRMNSTPTLTASFAEAGQARQAVEALSRAGYRTENVQLSVRAEEKVDLAAERRLSKDSLRTGAVVGAIGLGLVGWIAGNAGMAPVDPVFMLLGGLAIGGVGGAVIGRSQGARQQAQVEATAAEKKAKEPKGRAFLVIHPEAETVKDVDALLKQAGALQISYYSSR